MVRSSASETKDKWRKFSSFSFCKKKSFLQWAPPAKLLSFPTFWPKRRISSFSARFSRTFSLVLHALYHTYVGLDGGVWLLCAKPGQKQNGNIDNLHKMCCVFPWTWRSFLFDLRELDLTPSSTQKTLCGQCQENISRGKRVDQGRTNQLTRQETEQIARESRQTNCLSVWQRELYILILFRSTGRLSAFVLMISPSWKMQFVSR